tara:strand:+ start:279 stop:482 length:204 start_codon:yes stop_codon:yes gene_type:complete
MVTKYRFLKNHNTGDLIKSQEFTETNITGIPIYYYRNNKSIDTPNLKGYVDVSEKKYNRLMRNFSCI